MVTLPGRGARATRAQIRDLLEASFPGDGEAAAGGSAAPATATSCSRWWPRTQGVVVGYIGFSRLMVEGSDGRFAAVALAPLAVYPEYQQQGVATRLVQEAHACLAAIGETLSVVLGEPHFYGRFGYSNRRVAHFESEYQSPYLMALSFGAAPYARPAGLSAPPSRMLGDDAALPADDRV